MGSINRGNLKLFVQGLDSFILEKPDASMIPDIVKVQLDYIQPTEIENSHIQCPNCTGVQKVSGLGILNKCPICKDSGYIKNR